MFQLEYNSPATLLNHLIILNVLNEFGDIRCLKVVEITSVVPS